MHQDQRIGLALAVLLLGAAGAFFFRHDPKPAGSSPRLKSGRELDSRIAEKAISPYLQSGDDDRAVGTDARHVSDRTGDPFLPQLDSPDFFSESGRDQNVQELAPIPFPDANDTGTSGRGSVAGRSSGSSERTHVVQKGETLSSIAAKELGSSSRFHDLFEANRDQLKDANDVRLGMTLRIPSRQARTESASARSNGAPSLLSGDRNRADDTDLPAITVDPDQQATRRSTDPSAKKLFEPAKRPPMGVKAPGTQSSQGEPAPKPNRKLTQLPPKDATGKVAR